MAEISPKDVMTLRNRTTLPMMDCKAALIEAGGDMEKAEEILRKKLKGKMDTRTDRAAGEGRIGVAVSDDQSGAAIIEVRAESDFTAKNEAFVAMVQKVAKLALSAPAGAITATSEISAAIDAVRIATGENCSFARGFKFQGPAGATKFGTYVHHDGKTGSVVQGDAAASPETLRQICMHVVAASPKPQGVSAADVPPAVVEKERKFRIEQAMESGKPKEIAEKMVEGGMRKFFEEITLLEQPFIMDQTKKVKDLLTGGATVKAFQRWQVGEQA